MGRRMDGLAKSLSARIEEANRIDALQTTLPEIQRLLLELARESGSRAASTRITRPPTA
jgi:hypothetical protein